MITWGRYYWPFFLILGSLLFLVPEIIALVTNFRNTLSQYSWNELHVNPGIAVHTLAWYLSLGGWILFVIVISAHIWFRVDL
jgi:hypothetical protein